MLAFTYDQGTADEAVLIASSSIDAIHTFYTSQYHKQVGRFSATLYLMGSLLILVCVIVKNDGERQTRTRAIEAFKKGLQMHSEMSTNYIMSRHALRRIHLIIRRTQQVINNIQIMEDSQSEAPAPPEVMDFLSGDQSWIMDLDKDLQMLMPPFDGLGDTDGLWREGDNSYNHILMPIS
jgi:hypothetical protein